ncbi:hypothetical protein PAF17_08865, partial [Paracoccus sp. Z330]|nr:hypothetical protein [Paracoccus onchidii]
RTGYAGHHPVTRAPSNQATRNPKIVETARQEPKTAFRRNGAGVNNTGHMFTAYLFDTGNPAVGFDLGPQPALPTATENSPGSEKWSTGFANILFRAAPIDLDTGKVTQTDRATINAFPEPQHSIETKGPTNQNGALLHVPTFNSD